MKISFTLNGSPTEVEVADDTPLLWVLRDTLEMTGTKFGCGRGLCGACTVQVDGQAVRSCVFPARYLAGKKIRTVEGLEDDRVGQEVVRSWIDLDVVQCGWCQPGQCMTAAAVLAEVQEVDDAVIDGAMAGNLCRCGTYPRIREAVKTAAKRLKEGR